MQKNNALGSMILTLTAIIWGTSFAFQRVGMESIEPITFTAARMSLASLAIWLVAFLLGRREAKNPPKRSVEEEQLRRKSTLLGGICCGIFLTAASLFQQIGMVTTTAGKAGFITALYMVLVPIFNFILFRKRNSILVWAGVLIGVVGMYLLCIKDGFHLTHGDTLVCICAFLFTGHILCCDYFTRNGDPVRIAAIQSTMVFLISTVIAFLAEEPTWEKITSAVIPILYCGVVSAGAGYTMQLIGQKYTDPTIASLLMSLESVFAVLGCAVILHERMSPREALGCIIMFAAILLVQIPVKPKKAASSGF